jgi:hypothetical protein
MFMAMLPPHIAVSTFDYVSTAPYNAGCADVVQKITRTGFDLIHTVAQGRVIWLSPGAGDFCARVSYLIFIMGVV